uniref:Constitutive coactivator of PPAR-gamma-like protein 2 n=1 Tax=Lygus hesperus TaxID=30085 RepID=A0A146LZW3_LYGHE
MGIQDLQAYLESGQVEGSCVGVDLVRIARTQSQKCKQQVHKKAASGPPKFSLVIDAECCLDRLYGGYFSDWVCGGQWNRVTTFLGQFIGSLNASQIELVVFFNGCTEPQRTDEWIAEQLRARARISQVLRHLVNKGTPPPKVWWTAPSCLKPTLRLVLRNLSIPVCVTMDDHKQEVIAYCRENGCHAIVADDAEYIAFNPPRYFSARHLKLTYKGTLESKEYIISELTKSLQLNTDQLCILAALLGNFLLPESELSDLHKKLKLEPPVKSKDGTSIDGHPIEAVKAVAAFVKSLQSKELDDLGMEIFGAVGGERAAKFKQAVQYYKDGTKTGFLRFRPNTKKNNRKPKNGEKVDPAPSTSESGMDTSGFASEVTGNELAGLVSESEAFACLSVVGPDNEQNIKDTTPQAPAKSDDKLTPNGSLLSADASSSSSSAASPSRSTSAQQEQTDPKPQPKQKKQVRLMLEEDKVVLPPVASEIMRTVSERHTKGLMSPLIYQILTQGEVKLPVVMEDESFKEVLGIQQFYGPLRAMLYAILFNLNHLTYMARMGQKSAHHKDGDHHNEHHHRSGEVKLPEIKVKEWIWSKQNPYEKPEIVKAEPLGWGVPTIQRLWFGTTVDDKRRRLRTYLTVMRSDTHLMLNPSYVPQHLLILATVLRYIMTCPDRRVLRRHELDAIIAMAFDPHLANCDFNQELQVECVTPRGVQLGAMIMTGIEYALVVNDACGAPIPWLMTCPWLYFDGKLLHSTLARAATVKNIMELCEHRIPQVMKVETMREAILEGIFVQWARPNNIPSQPVNGRPLGRDEVHQVMPAGMGRGASLFRGPVPSSRGRGMTTGGRLEIAGVVVGNWGPNCRLHPNFMVPPPQVTSVGGIGSYNGQQSMRGGKGAPYGLRNGGNMRGGKNRAASNKSVRGQGKKKSSGSNRKEGGRKASRGRGMTVLSPFTGENVEATELLAQEAAHEEKKMILTNTEAKKQQNKGNAAQMVNGGHDNGDSPTSGTEPAEQFADALELVNLMAQAGINGECSAELNN